MHGCNGKMGKMISELAAKDEKVEIVAGVDQFNKQFFNYPVFSSIKDCKVEADVIIDFSTANAVEGLLAYSMENKVPVVLCTTGLAEALQEKVEEYSKTVAMLQSANMSLGINLLMKVLKDASKVLVDAGFDIEIIEKHHNQKLDAPSGTALALADSINEEFNSEFDYIYDRSTKREKRGQKELGISAVRGGSIVGEHDVLFAGSDEVITFSHTAYSRAVFAKGAIQAAKFLATKENGMYNMNDVINNN